MGGTSDDRMWRCQKKWNLPVSRSIAARKTFVQKTKSDLSSAIAWKSVVPQSFVWTLQRLLVVVMVAVSSYGRCKAQKCRRNLHFLQILKLKNKRQEVMRKQESQGRGRLQYIAVEAQTPLYQPAS